MKNLNIRKVTFSCSYPDLFLHRARINQRQMRKKLLNWIFFNIIEFHIVFAKTLRLSSFCETCKFLLPSFFGVVKYKEQLC
jgi:hypothetical protein